MQIASVAILKCLQLSAMFYLSVQWWAFITNKVGIWPARPKTVFITFPQLANWINAYCGRGLGLDQYTIGIACCTDAWIVGLRVSKYFPANFLAYKRYKHILPGTRTLQDCPDPAEPGPPKLRDRCGARLASHDRRGARPGVDTTRQACPHRSIPGKTIRGPRSGGGSGKTAGKHLGRN